MIILTILLEEEMLMVGDALLYIGAIIITLWGGAHIVMTKRWSVNLS